DARRHVCVWFQSVINAGGDQRTSLPSVTLGFREMSHKCANHSTPQKEFSVEQIVAVLEQAEAGVALAGLLLGSGFRADVPKPCCRMLWTTVHHSSCPNEMSSARPLDGYEINAWWVKSHHHSVHTH